MSKYNMYNVKNSRNKLVSKSISLIRSCGCSVVLKFRLSNACSTRLVRCYSILLTLNVYFSFPSLKPFTRVCVSAGNKNRYTAFRWNWWFQFSYLFVFVAVAVQINYCCIASSGEIPKRTVLHTYSKEDFSLDFETDNAIKLLLDNDSWSIGADLEIPIRHSRNPRLTPS